MTIKVLGVDPGVISGWALIIVDQDGAVRLVAYGDVGSRDKPCHGSDVSRLVMAASKDEPINVGCLAIESQFIPSRGGKGQQDRAKAVSALIASQMAGKWIGIAETYGWDTYQHNGNVGVPPSVWRAAIYGRKYAYPPTAQAKKLAVMMAEQDYGIKLPQTKHHTAEAIHIARYVVGERIRLGE